MPEFILDRGDADATKRFAALDAFTQGYLEAAFFTSTGTGDDGDLEHASLAELAEAAWQSAADDCTKFQADNSQALSDAYELTIHNGEQYDAEKAGRDFWFDRCGHGVGFWDRGLGDVGDGLAAVAKHFSDRNLYRGDDGRIYFG